MSRPVKILLYLTFIVMAVWFGLLTRANLRQATAGEKARAEKLDEAGAVEATNPPALENPNVGVLENTNTPGAAVTNQVATATATATSGSSTSYSKMIRYGLLACVGFIGFAFLLARDVAQFMANKAEEALFNDDGAPLDPEYEQAEELWKDGKYLEALNALREYLGKHPREQYVALRIAEIYEENLHNPLAAALEYEELLKKKLPAERWGWAAIHLANLYSGSLNQSEKSILWLRRIDSDYGQTAAASKARERLKHLDPSFIPAAQQGAPVGGDTTNAPASNLPPGFRPKS